MMMAGGRILSKARKFIIVETQDDDGMQIDWDGEVFLRFRTREYLLDYLWNKLTRSLSYAYFYGLNEWIWVFFLSVIEGLWKF